jgi:signal transduction histidine kinase
MYVHTHSNSHEVRNPLSSAIAALSFVSASVKLPQTTDRQKSIESDIHVIDASLNYINDLLRNMLDMQRASSKIISITMTNVDIQRDVFEPVAAVLYLRGVDKIKVTIECPRDLIIQSDRLRLKQIVLNLAMNSAKVGFRVQRRPWEWPVSYDTCSRDVLFLDS